MLQGYYLPSINMQSDNGWHLSHMLFITNTYQDENRSDEALRIDVENYRYDFSLAYQNDNWRLSATLPFIANDSGSLDGLIENWHDAFDLPQGGRTRNPDNQIELLYSRNGNTIFEQNKPDSDIGDLSFIVLTIGCRIAEKAIPSWLSVSNCQLVRSTVIVATMQLTPQSG